MRILTLGGPGAVRGGDFGRLERHAIESTASALKSHLARSGHSPHLLGKHLAASPLCRTAQRLTPDLWAEVVAIAGESTATLEDVLLLTFLDEAWSLTGGSGCSALARRTPQGRTEIGQTMDLPSWAQGRAMILRISPESGPAALVMTYPGMIGLCGANDVGLGVAVNALEQSPLDENGLGVAFITRQLLTLSTLESARQLLEGVPHAAGQAYTVAAPDGIATFEASSLGVEQVSQADATACAHTNHPLSDGSISRRSSAVRLASLMASIEDQAPLVDALSGDVVLDGRRLGDPNVTFAAFRYAIGEPEARFIDGDSMRAPHHEWVRVPFH